MYRPAVPFSFTALDVGQGDGLVVRSGGRTAFLIDGGSTSIDEVGTWRIIPYLKQQGIRQIEGIWISHEDQDHISGMIELLQAVSEGSLFIHVRALYLPEWMKETETADLFRDLCRKTGTMMYYVSRGDSLTADDDFTPTGSYHWTYKKYYRKVAMIGKVIMAAGMGDPPWLVGLAEIENEQVLKNFQSKNNEIHGTGDFVREI